MRAIKVLLGCMACLLLATGSASAARLELSTGEGPIAPGTQLEVGGGRFETPLGTLECPGLVVATLLNNNAGKDKVSIAGGAPSGPNGVGCNTSTALGTVEVRAGGLPWTQQLASSGKALLKAHRKLELTVTAAMLGVQCSYQARKLAETFPVAAKDVTRTLELSVANQVFANTAGSALFCPATVTANFAGIPVTVPDMSGGLAQVYVTRR